MTRYHAADDWKTDLIASLLMLALVVALIIGLNYCTRDERADCKARGGVWLYREQVCVAGPGGNNGR